MSNHSGFKEHHIKIMKVALALAILRQKPDSLSARDFTLSLARHLEEKELDWKKQVRLLERELLRKRQEVLEYQLQTSVSAQRVPQTGTQELDWQVDDGVELLGHSIVKVSSGIKRTIGSEEGEMGFPVSDRPLENTLSVERGKRTESEDKRLETHMKFLTSASRLMSMHYNKVPAVLASEFQDTVKDSIVDAIEDLKDALSQCSHDMPRFPYSKDLLVSSLSCIADLFSSPFLTPVKEELADAVISLMDVLINERSGFLSIEWLRSLVVMLCGVQKILFHVVGALTSQLCTSVHLFSRVIEGEVSLTAGLIDAAERQSATLEILLMKYDASKNIKDAIRVKMVNDLEKSLLHLSGSYPLFTYSVWRIVCKLTE